MDYDKARDEVVLFGGGGENGYLADTWTYNLGKNAWMNMNPPNAPTARVDSAMVYDDNHKEFILYGGTLNMYDYEDTWVYREHARQDFGNFISMPYDTGGNAFFGTISLNVDMPPETTLRVQFRSAGSKENLQTKVFFGPDGTAFSFYDNANRQINSVNNGTRWFQYRVYLGTGDLSTTPVLRGVTVNCNLLHDLNILSPVGGESWTDIHDITWSASDKDNDSLSFDIFLENASVSIPLALYLPSGSTSIPWNASLVPNGIYRIRIVARDNNPSIPLTVSAASGDFTVYHPLPPPIPNHPPHVWLVSPLDNSLVNTTSIRLAWLGTDPDNDPLTYSVSYSDRPFSQGAIKTQTATSGFFDLTNISDDTTYYWTVDASDGKSNSTDVPAGIWSFTVRFTPADIPVRFTSAPPTSAWVGKDYAYNLTSIDEDGDIPSYSLISAPSSLILDSSTGKLRWTPTTSDIGNHTITVRVSDGRGSTDNQTFTITVQEIPTPPVVLPKCVITYPANGAKINGTVQIKGTASNGSLPLSIIKVRIDNGTWTTAIGLSNWSFTLNTSKLAKGPHHIEAKAFAAELSSETASVGFVVGNPEPTVTAGGNPWCLPAVLTAVVAGVAVLILLKKRNNR
jgi:hypothetical protein